MKVIVVEQTGYSGSFTHVYEYSREAYIQMVKDELNGQKIIIVLKMKMKSKNGLMIVNI